MAIRRRGSPPPKQPVKAPAPPAPLPPPLGNESGSVEAIGSGESQTNLNFRPSKLTYTIIEETPGSPSCNPTLKPVVTISQFPDGLLWAIKFEWKNVAGVNFIQWSAIE
jgi:hypothetical protein